MLCNMSFKLVVMTKQDVSISSMFSWKSQSDSRLVQFNDSSQWCRHPCLLFCTIQFWSPNLLIWSWSLLRTLCTSCRLHSPPCLCLWLTLSWVVHCTFLGERHFWHSSTQHVRVHYTTQIPICRTSPQNHDKTKYTFSPDIVFSRLKFVVQIRKDVKLHDIGHDVFTRVWQKARRRMW